MCKLRSSKTKKRMPGEFAVNFKLKVLGFLFLSNHFRDVEFTCYVFKLNHGLIFQTPMPCTDFKTGLSNLDVLRYATMLYLLMKAK